METTKNSNSSVENGQIMTLKSYYRNLPTPTHPKKEFVQSIATKCRVTEVTVRNWIMYGFHPDNQEHIQIISEITGIPAENLWND